jgi:hypothetical protein
MLLPVFREVARQRGYAIGVHGSLARDIDLIACPWAFNACDPKDLADALFKVADVVLYTHREEGKQDGKPGLKPFGRLCWVLHVGCGIYIDLSVMPRSYIPPSPAGEIGN